MTPRQRRVQSFVSHHPLLLVIVAPVWEWGVKFYLPIGISGLKAVDNIMINTAGLVLMFYLDFWWKGLGLLLLDSGTAIYLSAAL